MDTMINSRGYKSDLLHQSVKFLKKILRIGGIEKLSFFESALLDFFLLHFHENQSKCHKVARMGRNFDIAKE